MKSSGEIEVLYNADCPVCRMEITHYEHRARQTGAPLGFTPITGDSLADWSLPPETALKRLHIRQGSTQLSGLPAFIAIWEELPRMRWLARLMSRPLPHAIGTRVYDHILAPLLYRWHLQRQKKRVGARRKSITGP